MEYFQVLLFFTVLLNICFCNHHRNETVKSSHNDTSSAETTTSASKDVESVTESNYDKIISGLKGVFKDFWKRHFLDRYHKVEDFFSSSKKELQQKVEDTQKYIALVTEQQRKLIVQATDDTKQKAQAVSVILASWFNDVSSFKEQVANSAKSEYHDLEEKWQQKITDKWNGGLETIIELSRKAEIDSKDQDRLITSLNITST